MRKLLALLILLGIVVASAGCIQEGDGGIIITFGDESYTIPTTSSSSTTTTNSSDPETYDCTQMELELVTVGEGFAGFTITSCYYLDGKLIEYGDPQGIPVGATEGTTTKCGYTVYITVHSVDPATNSTVVTIHTEPSNPGWDGENIVMYEGDVLRVSFS